MSWNIKSVGTPAAVRAAIQNNQTLSATLKAALVEICNDKPYSGDTADAISVDGSGHAGEGSYIYSLKVERLTLAKITA